MATGSCFSCAGLGRTESSIVRTRLGNSHIHHHHHPICPRGSSVAGYVSTPVSSKPSVVDDYVLSDHFPLMLEIDCEDLIPKKELMV